MNLYFVAGYTGSIGSAIVKTLEAKQLPVFGINGRLSEKEIKNFISEKLISFKKERLKKVYFINAIGCGIFGKFLELNEQDFIKSFECNFLVPIKLIQIFSKTVLEVELGKDIKKIIYNINSQAALKPFWNGAAYNSMKVALSMALKVFEKEYRQYGFKVYQIYPPVVLGTKIVMDMPYLPKNDKLVELNSLIDEIIKILTK